MPDWTTSKSKTNVQRVDVAIPIQEVDRLAANKASLKELFPHYTEEQLNDLKQWVIDEDMRPGKGLVTVKSK